MVAPRMVRDGAFVGTMGPRHPGRLGSESTQSFSLSDPSMAVCRANREIVVSPAFSRIAFQFANQMPHWSNDRRWSSCDGCPVCRAAPTRAGDTTRAVRLLRCDRSERRRPVFSSLPTAASGRRSRKKFAVHCRLYCPASRGLRARAHAAIRFRFPAGPVTPKPRAAVAHGPLAGGASRAYDKRFRTLEILRLP